MDIGFRLDVSQIKRSVRRLGRSLDEQLEHAMRIAGEKVAESARSTHAYQNRTGDLEASTQPLEPAGTFSEGTLEGGASATMFYASYVDENPDFQFMNPAYLFEREEIDQAFQDAINMAASAAGMAA